MMDDRAGSPGSMKGEAHNVPLLLVMGYGVGSD